MTRYKKLMDVDEVTCIDTAVKHLTTRLALVEAKLEDANHILGLLVEALKNPANSALVAKVTKVIMRERLGFLF